MEMSARNAFKKWTDLLHLALGIVAGALLKFPMGWTASLFIAVVYLIYQAAEAEEPFDSYMDMVEWLMGFAMGTILALAR